MATAVVVLAVVATAALVALLLRQRDPGRLSEAQGRRNDRRHVTDRPAGPDAEPMHPDPPNDFPAAR
jgi:hypothetical protein